MRLTMSGEVLSHELPLQAAIEITKSHDIKCFELWAQNCEAMTSNAHQRLYSNRDIKKAKKQFAKAGLKVVCVAFGGAFHQEITCDEERYVRELILAIEVASELGAELVNHYCNLISPGFSLKFRNFGTILHSSSKAGRGIGCHAGLGKRSA